VLQKSSNIYAFYIPAF